MAKKKHATLPADADTRERLLAAAAGIFAQRGFSGSTVKEIAEAAGCNISLISYHFQGKEGIFRALLESFGRERLRDAENILSPPDSREDLRAKLRLWMQQFLLCHVSDNSICSILHRENVIDHDFLWDIFQKTFLKTFEAMVLFFEAARKNGVTRQDVEPFAVANMVFGSLIHLGRNQQLQKKIMNVSIAEEKYRSQVIEQFLQVILNGIVETPA